MREIFSASTGWRLWWQELQTEDDTSLLSFWSFTLLCQFDLILKLDASEVKAATHPEKAPGPDGFTGLFYRLVWDTVKDDVMQTITLLEQNRKQGMHLLNYALLVLIPKVQGACRPAEFWPISLVHSFAKIFTKILARRLQPLMPALITPFQNAFIKGDTIHDNFVYVQGIIRSLRQKKISALMLKLDISKAFGSASVFVLCHGGMSCTSFLQQWHVCAWLARVGVIWTKMNPHAKFVNRLVAF